VLVSAAFLVALAFAPESAGAQGHDHEKMMREAAAAAAAAEADDVVPEITPDFDAVKSAEDPKHTPKITAPDKVTAGEWFDVTVEVGSGSRHPSLVEHHVRWIGIYKNDVELARAYLPRSRSGSRRAPRCARWRSRRTRPRGSRRRRSRWKSRKPNGGAADAGLAPRRLRASEWAPRPKPRRAAQRHFPR
jgi:desulfoferrodoxin (superoxide reductase-like protein)